MIGLGFKPFETAVMCLLANTAPVAFGGMGNPVRTLVAVTGLAGAGRRRLHGSVRDLGELVLGVRDGMLPHGVEGRGALFDQRQVI